MKNEHDKSKLENAQKTELSKLEEGARVQLTRKIPR